MVTQDTGNLIPDTLQDLPSAARMYDYFLGGAHNFEVDRRAAEAITAIYPDMPYIMRVNRAFLRRAVAYLLEQGVTQFLDVGSGIPTVGNVHEAAQAEYPDARVVYVDMDPIAVAHSQTILRGNPNARIIQADARRPRELLERPEVRDFIDLNRPVAVLLVAVLHFVLDDQEATAMATALRGALPVGGYFVVSHATLDGLPDTAHEIVAQYARTANPTIARSHAQVTAYFEGLTLVEPGVVFAPLWRPEGPDDLFLNEPGRSGVWAGVARRIM